MPGPCPVWLRSRTMEQRVLGKTGRPVSIVGLGTWQLGADWRSVTESDALDVLSAAVDYGVTFLDTADVYGDGRSEQIIGRFLADNPGSDVMVATKMGRRIAQVPSNYTLANFRAWIDRSRVNLGVDRLDLVQLHCPPTPVYYSDAVYDALDTLVAEERIAAYGVSVETCDEALAAIARPGVATVQIIFNAFRRKPPCQGLPARSACGAGILVRVAARSTLDTPSAPAARRTYNRHGESFDVGETFSGVDYATGVQAATEFAAIVAEPGAFTADLTWSPTTAQAALRWATQQPGVTTVIPGARNTAQARQNAAAGGLPPLSDHALGEIEELYDKYFRAEIHSRW